MSYQQWSLHAHLVGQRAPGYLRPAPLMLRPRDSHDMRLVAAELALSPPGNVRWRHDVFGNSVALVDFSAPAATLSIVSALKIERYRLDATQFPIAPEAEFYPFVYSRTASISAVCRSSTIPTPRACSPAGPTAS